jgi:hypothetical protein
MLDYYKSTQTSLSSLRLNLVPVFFPDCSYSIHATEESSSNTMYLANDLILISLGTVVLSALIKVCAFFIDPSEVR